jgi:predicted RND superfamily exporter protein
MMPELLTPLNEMWTQHQVVLTVVGVVLAGITITSLIAWVFRRIVRPAVALVSGLVTTGVGATVAGFITDASTTLESWVSGG